VHADGLEVLLLLFVGLEKVGQLNFLVPWWSQVSHEVSEGVSLPPDDLVKLCGLCPGYVAFDLVHL
jgi:hypothetical protein